MSQANCKRCGRPILIARVAAGRTVAFDAYPAGSMWVLRTLGTRRIAQKEDHYQPHEASCAGDFERLPNR